jgi:hypothetical protein
VYESIVSTSTGTFFFKFNLEHIAFKILAIELSNGLASFVTFHFQESKSFALAGKHVLYQLDGTYGPNCIEEGD